MPSSVGADCAQSCAPVMCTNTASLPGWYTHSPGKPSHKWYSSWPPAAESASSPCSQVPNASVCVAKSAARTQGPAAVRPSTSVTCSKQSPPSAGGRRAAQAEAPPCTGVPVTNRKGSSTSLPNASAPAPAGRLPTAGGLPRMASGAAEALDPTALAAASAAGLFKAAAFARLERFILPFGAIPSPSLLTKFRMEIQDGTYGV